MGQEGRFSSLMEITPMCRETDTVTTWLALHLARLFISELPPFPCGAHKRFHASLFGVALGCSQASKQLWVKLVLENYLCEMLGCRAALCPCSLLLPPVALCLVCRAASRSAVVPVGWHNAESKAHFSKRSSHLLLKPSTKSAIPQVLLPVPVVAG